MTCLTLTPESASEAVEERVDLVVAHHPMPFRPLSQITTRTVEGEILWRLARAGVSIYSPHTAFDSTAEGINAAIAEGLALSNPRPLIPDEQDETVGAGRIGTFTDPIPLNLLAERVKQLLGVATVRVVGDADLPVGRVTVACGSGGSLIAAAAGAGADAMVTGEATFHQCLAARASDLAMVLPGHYASERFAVERLAQWLQGTLAGLDAWASRLERDPLRTL
jgi:dinuclear metal center YbgI/SA1388 family protein